MKPLAESNGPFHKLHPVQDAPPGQGQSPGSHCLAVIPIQASHPAHFPTHTFQGSIHWLQGGCAPCQLPNDALCVAFPAWKAGSQLARSLCAQGPIDCRHSNPKMTVVRLCRKRQSAQAQQPPGRNLQILIASFYALSQR